MSAAANEAPFLTRDRKHACARASVFHVKHLAGLPMRFSARSPAQQLAGCGFFARARIATDFAGPRTTGGGQGARWIQKRRPLLLLRDPHHAALHMWGERTRIRSPSRAVDSERSSRSRPSLSLCALVDRRRRRAARPRRTVSRLLRPLCTVSPVDTRRSRRSAARDGGWAYTEPSRPLVAETDRLARHCKAGKQHRETL